ncbi:MAG TPA: preprotein translocase subunit YajC [Acidimicrobiales bacterium]|jgi:preprotein translocase subunit YajC
MTSLFSHALLLATTAPKKSSSGFSYIIIIYVVVIGGFYYFYMRPRNKRMREQRQQQNKVEVGERAQTIGGFVGTVVRSDADMITLRTDAGVELEFVHRAIARRYDPPTVPESSDDVTHEEPTEGDDK